jgi:hypothetical protein
MLAITPQDIGTVFAESTKPCVNVWVTPDGRPSETTPLAESGFGGSVIGNITPISPWARQLVITKTDPAATVLVEISRDVVNTFFTIANMTAADQVLVLPVPSRVLQVRITTSAGQAFLWQELAFT